MKNRLQEIFSSLYVNGQQVGNLVYSIVIKEKSIGIIIDRLNVGTKNIKDIEDVINYAIKDHYPEYNVLIVYHYEKNNQRSIDNPSEVSQNGATKKTRIRIPHVKYVISIVSCKGGVGKSTTVVNLANILSRRGYKVGILDADIYGPSIPRMLGIDSKPEVKEGKMQPLISQGIKNISMGYILDKEAAAIWRGPILTKSIIKLFTGTNWGELDYLLIDTPPGTGDVHLSIAENFITDGAIVVTTPQHVAIDETKRIINMLKKLRINIIGLIENMSYLALGEQKIYMFGRDGGKKVAEEYEIPFLGEIKLDQRISRVLDEGEFYNLDQDISEDYQAILNRISKFLE